MKDLSDLTPNQILRSLDDLVESNDYQDTEYGVWFHGQHISPARVITRAYELLDSPIDRRSITTNTAQTRLLDLGFPIVRKTGTDFFNTTELHSFSKLVEREIYDPGSKVDWNIADFLNQVPWEKSRKWAKGLESKGWVVKGRKNWNKRHGKQQGIKNYTWFRVYPKNRVNDLICFTVGIHGNGELVYKLDRMHADNFFIANNKEKDKLFRSIRDQFQIKWQEIPLKEIENYDWDKLINQTHKYFQNQLTNYQKLSDQLFNEYDRRIMRLTWNENNWEKPSGHKWREKDQGNTSIAYENQFGYGHEEWLFNHRYKKNEFHYGYVRGVNNMSEKAETIDELVLYSINPNDQGRYLVAEIRDVSIIEGTDEVEKIVIPLVEKYMDEAIEELDSVNADVDSFKSDHLIPNIKFKWDNVTIFNNPIPAPYLRGPEFNRFQAYRINDDLNNKLDKEIDESCDLLFIPGKASTSDSYDKKTSGGKTKVKRSHSQITNDLYDYLHKARGLSKEHISAEKTRVGGAIVDLAIKKGEELILFEAKTSSSGLSNIRQALGQLFEYAFLDESAKIKELVIVGPAELKEHEIGYLNRIRAMLKVPLNYWAYIKENKLEDRFMES
ncbi:hypothetical protein [Ekhidna sp.]|uniref:hypothetical protein n=1 Tax=Ekhidna sp. TaxID=2608089 RepID=UPI003B5C6242